MDMDIQLHRLRYSISDWDYLPSHGMTLGRHFYTLLRAMVVSLKKLALAKYDSYGLLTMIDLRQLLELRMGWTARVRSMVPSQADHRQQASWTGVFIVPSQRSH